MKIKFYLSIIFILLFSFSILARDLVAVVIKSNTVIRQTPNAKGKAVLTARRGQKFTILSYSKGWIRVVVSKRQYGWVSQSHITTRIEDRFGDRRLLPDILNETK